MNEQPILSIIIPTKNRYYYLRHLLQTINEFGVSNIEVVIQDNSDDNTEILEFIQTLDTTIFIYKYMKGKLSIIENSELAINNSRGSYLCFIGDDDGFIPDILNFVVWMQENKIDAALTAVPKYYWPDIVHKVHSFSGTLTVKKYTKEIKHIDAMKELRTTLRKGGTTMCMMPRLYHGIVSRQALDEIFGKCGSYFPGPSPDMANAVALCFVVKRYVYYDFPLIIAGAGYQSTGGAGARKQHIGRIEDIPHLPSGTSENWNKKIPKVWTGQTIWAESVDKSLENTHNTAFRKRINYNYLYAAFIVFHYELKGLVRDQQLRLADYCAILFYVFDVLALRGRYFIANLLSGKKMSKNRVIENIPTIKECIQQIAQNLNDF